VTPSLIPIYVTYLVTLFKILIFLFFWEIKLNKIVVSRFTLPRLWYLVKFAPLTTFVILQMLSENVGLRKNKFFLSIQSNWKLRAALWKAQVKILILLVFISVVFVKNRSRQLSQCYVQSTQHKLIDLRLRLETQPQRPRFWFYALEKISKQLVKYLNS